MTFPILGQQEAVQISTSFAIQGNDQGNAWEEGLDIPDAVPGSGVLGLKAGVGQFPAVLATADGVMAERFVFSLCLRLETRFYYNESKCFTYLCAVDLESHMHLER